MTDNYKRTESGLEYTVGDVIKTEKLENSDGQHIGDVTYSHMVFKGYENFGKVNTRVRPATQSYSVATDVNAKNYVENCCKTESYDLDAITKRMTIPQTVRLQHAAAGLTTEAGEFMDILKKHVFYGKEIDRTHAIKELGDALWYIAIAADALGVDLEEIMQANIQKLRDRYAENFSAEKALNRKEGDI